MLNRMLIQLRSAAHRVQRKIAAQVEAARRRLAIEASRTGST